LRHVLTSGEGALSFLYNDIHEQRTGGGGSSPVRFIFCLNAMTRKTIFG
jgi:hypothetical protein